jgi:hypothetical protein
MEIKRLKELAEKQEKVIKYMTSICPNNTTMS